MQIPKPFPVTNAFDWPENSDLKCSDQSVDMSAKTSSNSHYMKPMGLKNETHILTTNQLYSVNSKSSSKRATSDSVPKPDDAEQVEANKEKIEAIQWSSHGKKASSEVELSTVMAACPEFADIARGFVGGYVKNWNDLHRAAGILRPMVGISEDAWSFAQKTLGPWVAASAIALIYDKSAKGEVASAGGYLRGIVEKANTGELHLERSFYGRLNQSLSV